MDEIDKQILDLVKDPKNWTYTDPDDGRQGGWSPSFRFCKSEALRKLVGLSPESLINKGV